MSRAAVKSFPEDLGPGTWPCEDLQSSSQNKNPTGSLSTLFFEADLPNKPSHVVHVVHSLMLAAAAYLYLPPQSSPLPLSKHQRSIACSLWLIYRQCHPGEQRSLTSQSSSVAKEPLKFALISTAAAESCRGGGWCWCWCWVGGWLWGMQM